MFHWRLRVIFCVFRFSVGYQKVLQCLAQTRWYCQAMSLQKVEYPHYPSFTKLLTKNGEPEMSSLRWEVWLNWGAKLKSKTRDFLTDFLTRHQGRCFEGVNQCVCISRDI